MRRVDKKESLMAKWLTTEHGDLLIGVLPGKAPTALCPDCAASVQWHPHWAMGELR
jgi:hypothetical protein